MTEAPQVRAGESGRGYHRLVPKRRWKEKRYRLAASAAAVRDNSTVLVVTDATHLVHRSVITGAAANTPAHENGHEPRDQTTVLLLDPHTPRGGSRGRRGTLLHHHYRVRLVGNLRRARDCRTGRNRLGIRRFHYCNRLNWLRRCIGWVLRRRGRRSCWRRRRMPLRSLRLVINVIHAPIRVRSRCPSHRQG